MRFWQIVDNRLRGSGFIPTEAGGFSTGGKEGGDNGCHRPRGIGHETTRIGAGEGAGNTYFGYCWEGVDNRTGVGNYTGSGCVGRVQPATSARRAAPALREGSQSRS
ncbi:hypothetical protein D9M71_749400 [compost metagenome]